MKIKILTPIPFWNPATLECINQLRDINLDVEAIDIFRLRKMDKDGSIVQPYSEDLPSFIRKIYCKIFRRKFIQDNINKGDIVDIHFVDPAYQKYIDKILSKGNRLICTLFGSDLFRTNRQDKISQAEVFRAADKILMSKNMKPYFVEHFDGFDNKIIFNQYGSEKLDTLSKLNSLSNKTKWRQEFNIPDDSIVITCGYNAKIEQQHFHIIDSIQALKANEKKKLFLLFPLTYGESSDYKQKSYFLDLIKVIDNLDIPHIKFVDRLSVDQLIKTRIISDITVNTQTTDALASSIKEAFVSKNLLLVGDWLPYDIYKDLGIFFISSSKSELHQKIGNSISNLKDLKNKCEDNPKIILNFASWKAVINKWEKMYLDLSS